MPIRHRTLAALAAGPRTGVLIHRWFLLRELVRRDFQGRYAGSLLGFVWSFVQPLFLLGLYYFVFGTVLKVRLEGEGTASFGLFLFAGLLPWMAVQEGVSRGTTAVTDNAVLVKKLTFPSEILVLAVALAALVHEGIAALVFLVAVALLGQLAPGSLPWLLVALPLQMGLTLGLGLLLASLNVLFRDISQILGMVLMAWFFLTPIVYPMSQVPEWLQPWIAANPLTVLVSLYRLAFFGGELVPPWQVAGLVVVSLGCCVGGLALFRRLKPTFVDEI
jgi:lipopolysaccharide transport system permease protein